MKRMKCSTKITYKVIYIFKHVLQRQKFAKQRVQSKKEFECMTEKPFGITEYKIITSQNTVFTTDWKKISKYSLLWWIPFI